MSVRFGRNLLRLRLAIPLALLASVWLLFLSGTVSAHSSLTDAQPAPDSRLLKAPSTVVLKFNERLESRGFAIQVYDRQGKPVASNGAVLEAGRRAITLALPPLEDGSYTVAYRLLSADGHPVRGSYVFTVGLSTESSIGYVSASRLHEEHELSKNVSYWLVRGLYFFGLIAAAGWVGLRVYAPAAVSWDRRRYESIRRLLLGYHLLALLLLAWQDYSKLRIGIESAHRMELLMGTSIGLSYAFAIPAAFIGFWLTGRWRTVDAVWILLVFAAKGLNGHAMGYTVPVLSYALVVLHLTVASIWAGVLLAFTVVGARRLTEAGGAAAARLSKAAFAAIGILAVSGIVTAALYTNGFDRLLDSQWGRLMTAKAGAVLLVLAAGACIRHALGSGRLRRASAWLTFDCGLFVVVIGITAVFTYLNPLPASGPLFWHKKVDGVHIATIITPNQAGSTNQFSVFIGGGAGVGQTSEGS
ncbi:copper-binding protein [Paenibacillus curdlanolyticus]|nr:copper resistance protein CopC [Paenibacillus curdlanolyticus]GFN30151.1 copper-binding protein [Paenibacillus curdlanolyticus]